MDQMAVQRLRITGFGMIEDDLRILNMSERQIQVKLFALAKFISERSPSQVEIPCR